MDSDQGIFSRIMFKVVAIHIMQIGLGQLDHNIGGSHISIVTGQAVVLFGKIIQEPRCIAGVVWIMAVFTGILGHIQVVGMRPGICTVPVPGGSGSSMG